MDIVKDCWAVNEPYFGQEREGIFILLEAAGFEIIYTLRAHEPIVIERYPYIGKYNHNAARSRVIFGVRAKNIYDRVMGDGRSPIEYMLTKEELKNHLVELIKKSKV